MSVKARSGIDHIPFETKLAVQADFHICLLNTPLDIDNSYKVLSSPDRFLFTFSYGLNKLILEVKLKILNC